MPQTVDRPSPKDSQRAEEWNHTALRHRMLEGTWDQDARAALVEQFHPAVRVHLPPASISYNLFASLVDQTSSLYDGDEVALQFTGEQPEVSSVAMLDLDTFWGVAADNLRFVRGLNESYIRRGWNDSFQAVTYEIITPDCVDAKPDPSDPSQPNFVRHLVKKWVPSLERHLWCWAEWDLRNPDKPSYRILVDGHQLDGEEDIDLDATAEIAPEAAALRGNWPYWTEPDGKGEPIWPWTLYHSKVTNYGGGRLHKPYLGREAVESTLEASTDWTHWRSGLLNSAHAQRVIVAGKLRGTSTEGDSGFVPANAMFIAQIEGTEPGVTPSIDQWTPAFEVKPAAEAIMSKATMAAMSLGLAPGDVQVGASSGPARTSSIAIQVTRQGRRAIESKLVRPMRKGDQHNFAGAAQMANAFGGADLPTDPRTYRPVYAHTALTPAESNLLVDSLVKRVDAGLMFPPDAIKVLEPWLGDEESVGKVLAIQAFRQSLQDARGGTVDLPAEDGAPEEMEATEEAEPTEEMEMGEVAQAIADEPRPSPGVEKEQDTALNGAQVKAARDIVIDAVDGTMTRDMAIAMLIDLFNRSREAAEAMTKDVDALQAARAAGQPQSTPEEDGEQT